MLQKLIENSAIDSALIFDKTGSLVDSLSIEKPNRIAALSNTILEMCKGLAEELDEKKINQIVIKGETLLIIGTKIEENQYLVTVTNDVTKLGLTLKVLESL